MGNSSLPANTFTYLPNSPSRDWLYDNLGQVIEADHSDAAQDRSYQFDAIGKRKKTADSLTKGSVGVPPTTHQPQLRPRRQRHRLPIAN